MKWLACLISGGNAVKLPRRRFLRLAANAAALPAVSRIAWAQTYPTRPVRAVVAFAPGGVTDTFARLMAQKLTEQLGKQVYVENIAGASGNIGTGQVAKAAPDGYTILFAFSSHVVNPTLFARVPYDPIKDFDPVTLAVASTTVLTVNPSVPAKTVKELVDLIKANPGKYSFGSAGAGTQAHLAGEQFRLSLGLDLVHVPFGGGGPAVAAVVAGHTPISFVSPQAAMQHVGEGTVRALAVTSKTRSQIFPDVPTMAEAGYPDIEGDGWVGLLVPAGTPAEIIAVLSRESRKILAQPDMKERLATLGYDVVASTPKEFATRIAAEIEMWAKVIRAANIKAE
jgi:tripartite-type tricarboxylate transporter receptor subunit TctC